MKRHALTAAVLLFTGLLGPGAVLADTPTGKPVRAYGQHFQQRLGLTDAQMQSIRDIWTRQMPAARQVWQSLGKARQDIRQLALGGADDATIRAKMTEIDGLQSQALQIRVATLREIAPLLNDEQKQKFSQMSERRGHRRPRQAPQG
jgi:Spy/CpxP family protein refolding chaperone